MLEIFIKYLLLTTIIIDTCIAWFVLIKNPKRAVNQAYWLFVTAITIWQITNFLFCYYPFESAYMTELTVKLTYPAGAFVAYLMWYFIDLFPNNSHKTKRLIWMSILLSIFSIMIVGTDWLLQLTNFAGPGKNDFEYQWLYGPYIIVILVGVFLIFSTLYKKYRTATYQREKIQIQYLIAGLGILTVIGVSTNLITPIIRNVILGIGLDQDAFIYNIGPTGSIFLSTFVAYAILRHRLLDIKVILQRKWCSRIFTSMILLIILIISINTWNLPLIASVLIGSIVLFFPLERGIATLIRQWIKKEVIDLFKITDVEKKFLKTCNTPESFFRTLASQIMQRIPLENLHCIIYDPVAQYFFSAFTIGEFPHLPKKFNTNEKWMEPLRRAPNIFLPGDPDNSLIWNTEEQEILKQYCDEKNIQLLIPLNDKDMQGRNRLLGVIVIGNRIDRSPLSSDDIFFLTDVQKTGNRTVYPLLNIYTHVSNHIDDSAHIEELNNRKATV